VARGDESFNMSGGEQTRDFMSPDEIAATLVKIALQTKVEGIINCCSGKAVKLRDKVEGFLAEHQYTLRLNLGHYPYPDYEPMHTWGSVKKLQGIG
jgi:dTDP-6-deoxy-L-talose 4-dehydrogenase (NAD+)